MTSPRRRGPAAASAFALVLFFAACSDEEALDPQMRAPATGVYTYDALIYTDEGVPPDTFTGTLDIDVSSEDSIVGTWNVDGFETEARGIWNITAYTLAADPQPPIQGTITHRVWRETGSGDLSCQVNYLLEMPSDTFSSTSENSCSLDRE